MRRSARHARCRFVPLFAAVLALGLAAPTFAGMIEGDGKGKAANDCMVELSIDATPTPTGPAITCSDCDGTCDADATQDDQCSFAVKLCVNQTGDSACTPTALKKAFANVKGVHGLKKLAAPASLGGDASCGTVASNFIVKVRGKKKNKPGKAFITLMGIAGKGKAKRVDKDRFTLTCTPHGTCKPPPTLCPANTTTTTLPSSCGNGTVDAGEECDDGNRVDGDGCDSNCTTSRCGNGIKAGIEQCDPPCGGGCGAGQVCTDACTCSSATACACGTPDPTMLKFTSAIGSGTCGQMKGDDGNVLPNICAGGSSSGQPCTTTNDCPGGICSTGTFVCGGLYFGGGGVSVPLPSVVPDMSTAMSKVTSCTNTCLALGGSTAAEAGGNTCSGGANHHNACTTNTDCPGGKCNLLHCTSANCLFGPPLPVTNPPQAQLSTCIVNRIARDATGTASCGTGETSALSVPLNSDIYLTGNLLVFRCSGGTRPGEPCTGVDDTSCAPGTCEDDSVKRCTDTNAPCQADSECTGVGAACAVPIRPCPVCNTVTNKCNGGPNNGFACTPGDSASLGTAYPTTHDCPPPPEKFLGTLPIAFQLTTGTTRRKSVDNLPAQSNVFCGFCRHPSTLAFAKGRCTGGTNANNPCLFETDCPGGTCTTTQGVACSRCSGGSNDGFSCAGDNDCPGGTCPSAGNASCHEACNGGSNPTMPCDVPNCGSGGTCTDGVCVGGPTPCARCCAGGGKCLGGYTSCQQHTTGAFGQIARTIEATGTPAGNGTDHLAHDSTLVSVFCIPPTLRNEVDAAADLPGPGVVGLPGKAQLLP